MKYRVIAGIIGISMMMAVLSGCSNLQGDKETELQSLEIADMEIVEMTQSNSDTESGSEAESLAMELDLSNQTKTPSAGVEKQTGNVAETQTEETQAETIAATEPETLQLPEAQQKGAGTQTDQKSETLPDTEKVPEKQKETEKQTEKQTEQVSETQKATERLTEKESESEEQSESVEQADMNTEVQTEDRTEAETEERTESQTGVETEEETETETEETETETETETEKEIPKAEVRIINDRVNVRQEPSTEAEIEALLICGMRVAAIEANDEWSKIRYEGSDGFQDGFVKTEFLSAIDTLYTAKEKVNVRKTASTESDKVGALQAEEKVVVEKEEADEWLQIRFMNDDNKVVSAFVKAEFLNQVPPESLREALADELERLQEEAGAAGTPVQSSEAAPQANDPETPEAAETEAQNETETESEEETERQSEAETEEEAETEQNQTNTKTMQVTVRVNLRKEPSTEAEILSLLVAGTKVQAVGTQGDWTKVHYEAEENGLDGYIKSEYLTEEGAGTASENKPEEDNKKPVVLKEGTEGQLDLAKLLFPEVQAVGIIYSKGNKGAKKQLASYEKLAASRGLTIVASEIDSEMDIDIVASELVSMADCILCIEDDMVTPLVQTVRAYADEGGIPVIGMDEGHVKQGCVAAFADGKVLWNTEEAAKLGLNSGSYNFKDIKEY
ncbi:MAG: SH3 domain-containing protein [Lachnospiraceae bacterium]|nr:SH3 domain-containing protein [Lachnospiraceae bacterium]